MRLFKAFCKIAWRQMPSLSIYFIIYAIITFILGTTSQNNIDANFQTKSLDICVIDEDQSEASKALTGYLDSMHNLVELENDPEVLQDNLYYRFISYVLIIPEGFEEKLTKGDKEGLLENLRVPGSTSGYFIDQQVDQYLLMLQVYMAGDFTLTEAVTLTEEALLTSQTVESLTFETQNASNNKEVFYFYQYLPYIFIVMLVCGMTPILVTFQKKDLLERTNCSSLTVTSKNTQLALGCIVYSFFVWLLFMLLAFFVYGKTLFTANSLYGMLNSFIFLLIAAGLTLFISNFAPDSNAVNMISNMVGLGMSFLCGVFVPQNMLAESVLIAGRFLPAYWYIRANNMLAGFSTELFNLDFYWMSIGIQLLFAAAIFGCSLVAGKLRRQRVFS